MIKGEYVNVYEDFISEKKLEGSARLIAKICTDEDSVIIKGTTYSTERWLVNFGDTPDKGEPDVERNILVKNEDTGLRAISVYNKNLQEAKSRLCDIEMELSKLEVIKMTEIDWSHVGSIQVVNAKLKEVYRMANFS